MLIHADYYEVKYNEDLDHDNLKDLLERQYPDLYDSVAKDYIIEYTDFDIFREIRNEGEIIGFLTLKQLEERRFSIEECYITPEFRRKGIILDEILTLLSIPNVYLYARRPNFAFISMLQKHSLVEDITGKIVGIGMDVIADSPDIYTNPDIDFLYDMENPFSDFYADYVYDMKSRLIYIQDVWANVSYKPGMINIVKPRKSDLEKYNYRRTFKKFNPIEIDRISARLYPHNQKIENSRNLIDNELWRRYNVDKVVGKPDKLSDEMKELLLKNGLDESVGFKIRNHISDANRKVRLKEKYNRFRMHYLVKNPDKITQEPNQDFYYEESLCPLCRSTTYRLENCNCCGFDFENIGFYEKHLKE